MVQHSAIDHSGLTGVGDVAAHEADTTSVHGVANTANLYVAGGTDVAVADGGTGASTAAAARTALGLVIGTDVQAFDADISTVSASQGEMEAGTEAALRSVSPLRVAQAIAALGGTPADILDIPTAETDDTLVLAPDGAGGVEFRAEAGGGGGLSYQQNQMTADVTTTNANQFYDGPAVTLSAGTWLICASISLTMPGAATNVTMKVWDGTTVAATIQDTANSGYNPSFSLSVVVVIGAGTPTWKASVAMDSGGGTIRKTAFANGTADTASTIVAVKIA